MMVKNETYEVIVVTDPKTNMNTYGARNRETSVIEIYSSSIVYINVFAVEANRQVLAKVWNQDLAEHLASLMMAADSPKTGGKAN